MFFSIFLLIFRYAFFITFIISQLVSLYYFFLCNFQKNPHALISQDFEIVLSLHLILRDAEIPRNAVHVFLPSGVPLNLIQPR